MKNFHKIFLFSHIKAICGASRFRLHKRTNYFVVVFFAFMFLWLVFLLSLVIKNIKIFFVFLLFFHFIFIKNRKNG